MSVEISTISIGVWGVFAALGIGVGIMYIAFRATNRPETGLSTHHVLNVSFWSVLASIIGARLLYILTNPGIDSFIDAISIHQGGLSAFGGIFAAVITGVLYIRRYRISVLVSADIAAPGILLAEGIVRIGSSVVRNHPGRVVGDAWFAVAGPDGMPRHEVGAYLSLAAFIGFMVILFIERRYQSWVHVHPGVLALGGLIWYSGTRIVLDFLRAADLPHSDPRYAGLTITQYIAILLLICAVLAIRSLIKKT